MNSESKKSNFDADAGSHMSGVWLTIDPKILAKVRENYKCQRGLLAEEGGVELSPYYYPIRVMMYRSADRQAIVAEFDYIDAAEETEPLTIGQFKLDKGKNSKRLYRIAKSIKAASSLDPRTVEGEEELRRFWAALEELIKELLADAKNRVTYGTYAIAKEALWQKRRELDQNFLQN